MKFLQIFCSTGANCNCGPPPLAALFNDFAVEGLLCSLAVHVENAELSLESIADFVDLADSESNLDLNLDLCLNEEFLRLGPQFPEFVLGFVCEIHRINANQNPAKQSIISPTKAAHSTAAEVAHTGTFAEENWASQSMFAALVRNSCFAVSCTRNRRNTGSLLQTRKSSIRDSREL
jgi:hypothetical protein